MRAEVERPELPRHGAPPLRSGRSRYIAGLSSAAGSWVTTCQPAKWNWIRDLDWTSTRRRGGGSAGTHIHTVGDPEEGPVEGPVGGTNETRSAPGACSAGAAWGTGRRVDGPALVAGIA